MSPFVVWPVVVVALTGLLAGFSSGPIGPESIGVKDIQSRVDESAKIVNALARGPDAVAPGQVPLPFEFEAKRILKNVYASADERAEAYTIEHGKLLRPVRCLVRVRGDHVIGIAIDETAPETLRAALRSQFPGYVIGEFSPNLQLQRTPTAPLT